MVEGVNIPPAQLLAQITAQTEQRALPQNLIQNLIAQVNQQLATLPANTTLFTTVLASDKNGNALVKLAGSELVLSSPLLFAKGAQLALRVDNASGTVNLQLLSVDGKLPATQPQAASNQLQDFNLQAPPVRIINVLTGAKPEAQAVAPQQVVRADSVILSNQQSPVIRGVIISTPPEVIQNIKALAAGNLPDEAAKKLTDSLPQQIKSGTEANFKVLNVQAANLTATSSNLNNMEKQFQPEVKFTAEGNMRVNAMVLGTNNNNEVLVTSPLGRMIMDAPIANTKLQPGSIINLQFQQFTSIPQDVEAAETLLQSLSKSWPGLNHLALHTSDPDKTLNKLAGLDSLFASRMIDFIGAVKNNKLEDWLGQELLKDLDAGTREEIIAKMKGDFGNLRQALNDGQSWQTLFFPVYDGEELQQARMFVKYLKDEDGKPSKNAGTRFLVELETGFFGEVQFDGLVRNFVPSKNFDLIIRTKKSLGQEVRQDITSIFNSSAEITGIKGSIEFSIMKDFPVHPLNEKLAKTIPHEKIDV